MAKFSAGETDATSLKSMNLSEKMVHRLQYTNFTVCSDRIRNLCHNQSLSPPHLPCHTILYLSNIPPPNSFLDPLLKRDSGTKEPHFYIFVGYV